MTKHPKPVWVLLFYTTELPEKNAITNDENLQGKFSFIEIPEKNAITPDEYLQVSYLVRQRFLYWAARGKMLSQMV